VTGLDDFKYDMRGFQAGLADVLATTRRDLSDVMQTQARGLVALLLSVTPPMSGKAKDFTDGKRRGERMVEIDVNRVLYEVKRPKVRVNPQQVIDAQRSKLDGRVRGAFRRRWESSSVKQRHAVSGLQLRQELRRRKTRVGWLASGWLPAARKLGVRVPAWISRHPGDGYGGEVFVDDRQIFVRLVNNVYWAKQVKWLRGRVQWCIDEQGAKMVRAAEFSLRRARTI
jgi:hypothetical protein